MENVPICARRNRPVAVAALLCLALSASNTAFAAELPASSYKPSDRTYRVRYLPNARMQLDGRADEPQWAAANVEKRFLFPWNADKPAPQTEFRALCDDSYLYFTFQCDDADMVVVDKLRDKQDIAFEDRVEMYFCSEPEMKDYFCAETDSRGRAMDYKGSYYRKMDMDWHWPGLETKAAQTPRGYTVEGRIPLASFEALGFPRLRHGVKILCGLYRAEFSHDRGNQPIVERATIHNRGRKAPGRPPIEGWLSWIDPKTPEPDYHVPSSLGWLEIVK